MVGASSSTCPSERRKVEPRLDARADRVPSSIMVVRVAVVVLLLAGCSPPTDEAFTTATPLRSFADPAHLKIGSAVWPDGFDNDDLYKNILGHQLNTAVAEHFMGMDVLQATRGQWDFTRTEAFLKFAADHQMAVRGPTLIYGKDNPKWLDEGSWTRQDLDAIITEHVTKVLHTSSTWRWSAPAIRPSSTVSG
jgi:endo-1,4-beta-xylanase